MQEIALLIFVMSSMITAVLHHHQMHDIIIHIFRNPHHVVPSFSVSVGVKTVGELYKLFKKKIELKFHQGQHY